MPESLLAKDALLALDALLVVNKLERLVPREFPPCGTSLVMNYTSISMGW